MAAVEESEETLSAVDEAYRLLKNNFKALLDLTEPDEMCDELYSANILSDEEAREFVFSKSPLKDRKRRLLYTALQKIKGCREHIESFLVTLEKVDSELVQKLCGQIREIMKGTDQYDQIKLQKFKRELSALYNCTLQSDENIDAKYTVIRECVTSFFKSQFESSVSKSQLQELLNRLCYKEMIIPADLYSWSFAMLEEITRTSDASVAINEAIIPPQADKKLFSEAIVHNCLILCCLVVHKDGKKYLDSIIHDFDELSVSKPQDPKLERYVIAKREKDKELYIGFLGEPDLEIWQESGIISEGITKQTDHFPVRFFVEQIQDGYSIIFTGFEFGGLLALSVYASVWKQTCLSISNLSQSTMCVTFGVPLVPLKADKILDECHTEMKENSHIFQLQGDYVSRLLQFDDITNGVKDHDKLSGKIGAVIVGHLLKCQAAVKKNKSADFENPLSELKIVLSDDHLTKPRDVKLLGTYHYIHSAMVSQVSSERAQEILKIPSAAELDKIPKNSNIMDEHSIEKYNDCLKKFYFRTKNPPSAAANAVSLLKPDVSSVTFYRHGDEIALVLQGQNLWFCSKICINGKNHITIDHLEADAINRSVRFNYTPKNEKDLIIERHTETVDILLYSHFASPIKRKVSVKCMGEYHISYRQRQLAICTPGEVITLSFLTALLECTSDGVASKRYKTICRFLEAAARIVPIESICYTIANSPQEIAWKCTEAFFSIDPPPPSIELAAGLEIAYMNLAVGSDPAFLDHLQRHCLQVISQMSSSGKPIPSVLNVHVPVPVPRSFSEVVQSNPVRLHQNPLQPLDRSTLLAMMNKLRETAKKYCVDNSFKTTLRVISGANVRELFATRVDGKGSKLLSPIDVLKMGRKKLDALKAEELENDIFRVLDKSSEEAKKYYNEEMLKIIQNICNDELLICTLLLGGFMEQRIRVPLVDSPLETAHILQTTEAPPAVGVWALFSLGMIDFEKMSSSKKGKAMVVKVEKYIKGIFTKSNQASDQHSEFYAGKLQFLLQCLKSNETVSCNTNYISYSLETQLADLCSRRDIKPATSVKILVNKWDDYFKNNLLCHVLQQFRPLVARWIIWCLNIHRLREELASHTTVGIMGLSNSGKSCLVKKLFRQKTAVGSTSMQRTTVSFLYNLEGIVNGLSVIDFPGIDDGDSGVMPSQLLLRIPQLIVFVLDFKRWETNAALKWIHFFKSSGIPILICLSHADKLYASTCIGDDGTEIVSKDNARRFLQQELEKLREKLDPLPNWEMGFYSFCQDKDSSLNCDQGRQALSDVGILSCNDVGVWIEKELREYLKEEGLAERWKYFLASEKKKDENSKPKQAKTPTVVDDCATGLTRDIDFLNEDKDAHKAKSYSTPFEASEVIKLLRHAKFGFTKSFQHLLSELCIPTDKKEQLKKEANFDNYDCEFPTEKAIDWWITNKEGSWEDFLEVLRNCDEVTAASYIEKRLV
ncbi:PREDICTED: uncharacterized protein LOC109582702 [Amphimedon queenslandica]|uniref:G domain-containing protein n=2 Tax=Amphimedon queenslandica TaxID=400682 RepID=A0AAN0J8S8_AMPQE|nr:PREDICTED: uncharacterized protein LOC109582702 [Amphimedon queenslandica]|eukprot:XP_019853136.1 PREDICTED: uncharacterized protein LOC109582702 [Amphimedon queenslandica]